MTIRTLRSRRPGYVTWSAGSPPERTADEAKKSNEALVSEPSSAPVIRVQEPVFTPDGSKTWNDEQIPPLEELKQTSFDSQYVMLSYNSALRKVEVHSTNIALGSPSENINTITALSKLENASAFLEHFPALEAGKYELMSGGKDKLIFKKTTPSVSQEESMIFKNKVAADEAASQPLAQQPEISVENQFLRRIRAANAETINTEGVKQSLTQSAVPEQKPTQEGTEIKQTATVLDDVPAPTPGPSAPIAPPSSSGMPRPDPSQSAPSSQPKVVRRTEEVFSGTSKPESIASFQGVRPSRRDEKHFRRLKDIHRLPGGVGKRRVLFARSRRAIRRIIKTILALGIGAYLVGFIAEGIGAEAQRSGHEGEGPRKKIVMTGQRPGIYSTESSRE